MRIILPLVLWLVSMQMHAQNVGIGTNSPVARLHVADSGVLFSGPGNTPEFTSFNPPASGPGSRMMWYPQQSAFRVGEAFGDGWNKSNIGRYSFSAGVGTIARGEASVSLGYSNTASGFGSTSLGVNTTAAGDFSFTAGLDALAPGYGAISMGLGSNSTGYFSLSTGNNTRASGVYASSFGSGSEARGLVSTSMGLGTVAVGDYSTSLGYLSIARGIYSASFGYRSEAVGLGSLAMGEFTKARSSYSLVAGRFNDSSNTNRLFEIGNGSSDVARHNAFTVLTNGNVGISTATPVNRLDVEGLNNWDLSNTEGDMRIGNSSYRIKFGIALDGGGAGAASIRAAGGIQQLNLGAGNSHIITMNGGTGFVGIGTTDPTQKLHVVGNILASGTITPSDSRYKKDIVVIDNALEKLQRLHGVNYHYRTQEFARMGFSETKQIGLIAQEVENVFPEAVYIIDEEGHKGVDYAKLVPVLIEAIKQQQGQIEALKQALKNR